MSQDIYSQFLRFAVTESAAATLTSQEILTGASVSRVGGQSIALEIHAIGVSSSMPADAEAANVSEYNNVCISTRGDLTTMPDVDADHVVYRNQKLKRGGVATYLPIIFDPDGVMPAYVEFKFPLLISHPKLYAYVQTSNAAAAGSVRGYIIFTYVLLSDALAIEALEAFR